MILHPLIFFPQTHILPPKCTGCWAMYVKYPFSVPITCYKRWRHFLPHIAMEATFMQHWWKHYILVLWQSVSLPAYQPTGYSRTDTHCTCYIHSLHFHQGAQGGIEGILSTFSSLHPMGIEWAQETVMISNGKHILPCFFALPKKVQPKFIFFPWKMESLIVTLAHATSWHMFEFYNDLFCTT